MEKQKVLITGITGFAGSHLAELLLGENKYEIFGTHVSDRGLKNVESIQSKIQLHKVNLMDFDQTHQVVATVRPDIIYHLAASTHVGESFKKPAEVITNNATSQINIFESVLREQLSLHRILVASSSHCYGYVRPEQLPLSEDTPFTPDNPYSVSKITQDYLGLSYFLAYKLPIIRMRPFNHIGPRLSGEISVSRFAKTIAEIEKGMREPVMKVGNMTSKRDFTDVRDIVLGYALAVSHGDNGEAYNIGSGTAYSMQHILDRLLSKAKVSIKVESETSLFRPSDIPELRCDATKFKNKTGWEPKVPLEKSLEDTLDYWRGIL